VVLSQLNLTKLKLSTLSLALSTKKKYANTDKKFLHHASLTFSSSATACF